MEKPVLFCILRKTHNEMISGTWDTYTGRFVEDDDGDYYVAWTGNFVAQSDPSLAKLKAALEKQYGEFRYVEIDTRGWNI